MNKVTPQEARRDFYPMLNNVLGGNPAWITCKNGNCIVISEEMWNSLKPSPQSQVNSKTQTNEHENSYQWWKK